MSVKRYGLHIASQFQINDQCCYIDTRVEKKGKWTRYSEYAALESRYNDIVIAHDALLTRHTAMLDVAKSVLEWEYIKLVTEDHIDGDGLCRSLDALAALVGDE